ncbi:MAG: 4Fe-4S dicluster domain-containing protein [Chloroflexi bacterium]|nr:4Fe-4S dicluster domain-containing protein [Chloroflexota bacterium]MDL1885399.1 4Fe-4S dicluster domain-containing protein [Anaerolineae bacterium CFX8]
MSDSQTLVKPWHGIPREEIHWNPAIVAERCIGCGLCVTSCGRQVYQFDYEHNVAVVANPLNCMVGCSTCATICPREAIEFPSRGYIQQIIRDRKILRESKDKLRENQAIYRIDQS